MIFRGTLNQIVDFIHQLCSTSCLWLLKLNLVYDVRKFLPILTDKIHDSRVNTCFNFLKSLHLELESISLRQC